MQRTLRRPPPPPILHTPFRCARPAFSLPLGPHPLPVLMQRGIRFNQTSQALWAAYVGLEVRCLLLVLRHREALGITEGSDADDGASGDIATSTDAALTMVGDEGGLPHLCMAVLVPPPPRMDAQYPQGFYLGCGPRLLLACGMHGSGGLPPYGPVLRMGKM